jgi:hypothetical protein
VRGFSHQIFRSFSLSFFIFSKREEKARERVCVVFALRFLVRRIKEGDFDLRETLSSDEEKKEKKTCRLFPHSRKSERVRETIIVSSSAAAAWHKVVVVVVEVEMA